MKTFERKNFLQSSEDSYEYELGSGLGIDGNSVWQARTIDGKASRLPIYFRMGFLACYLKLPTVSNMIRISGEGVRSSVRYVPRKQSQLFAPRQAIFGRRLSKRSSPSPYSNTRRSSHGIVEAGCRQSNAKSRRRAKSQRRGQIRGRYCRAGNVVGQTCEARSPQGRSKASIPVRRKHYRACTRSSPVKTVPV